MGVGRELDDADGEVQMIGSGWVSGEVMVVFSGIVVVVWVGCRVWLLGSCVV